MKLSNNQNQGNSGCVREVYEQHRMKAERYVNLLTLFLESYKKERITEALL